MAELVTDAAHRALDGADGGIDDEWYFGAFRAELSRARDHWQHEFAGLGESSDPVDALSHAKFMSSGGACTLTAGLLGPAPDGRSWQIEGLLVGDTPLFHLRPGAGGHRLVAAVPFANSEEFDSSPDLIRSKQGRFTVTDSPKALRISDVRPDDVILVATDGLAEWAMMRAEKGYPVWHHLAQVDKAGFETMLNRIRATDEIQSDDVLLLRMSVVRRPLPTSVAVAACEELAR